MGDIATHNHHIGITLEGQIAWGWTVELAVRRGRGPLFALVSRCASPGRQHQGTGSRRKCRRRFANHQEDATICKQITNGVCTWLSLQAQIWNSGRVVIFRDGQMYEGTWTRTNRSDMLTFTDASGNPLPLQIGNSWFQMMSLAYVNPLTVTP